MHFDNFSDSELLPCNCILYYLKDGISTPFFAIITNNFYILPKKIWRVNLPWEMTEIYNHIISLVKWYHKCTRYQAVRKCVKQNTCLKSMSEIIAHTQHTTGKKTWRRTKFFVSFTKFLNFSCWLQEVKFSFNVFYVPQFSPLLTNPVWNTFCLLDLAHVQ